MHDFAYGDLVFDGREPRELPRDAGRARRSASSSSRCRRPTGWPAGGSGSCSATRRSSRGSTAPGSRARRDLPAAPGGRDRGAHRPAGHGRGAARALRGAARPRARGARAARRRRSCEGTFFVWLRLPDGVTADAAPRRAARRARARRGLRRDRPRLGAASRSRRRTSRSTLGSSGSRPRSRRSNQPHEPNGRAFTSPSHPCNPRGRLRLRGSLAHMAVVRTAQRTELPLLNRELSWLDFNARVLELAADPSRAAARARQVLLDLLVEPGRVLHGARRRPRWARRRRRPASARPTGGRRGGAGRDPRAGRSS